MPRRQPAAPAMARLVDSAEFERVLSSRSRARTAHFAVHHLSTSRAAEGGRPAEALPRELSTVVIQHGAPPVDEFRAEPLRRLGVVVPKRHAKRAVTRSLLKRQIYAAGSRHGAALPGGVWVVRLRAPFDRAHFTSAASMALRDAASAELDVLFSAARGSEAP